MLESSQNNCVEVLLHFSVVSRRRSQQFYSDRPNLNCLQLVVLGRDNGALCSKISLGTQVYFTNTEL